MSNNGGIGDEKCQRKGVLPHERQFLRVKKKNNGAIRGYVVVHFAYFDGLRGHIPAIGHGLSRHNYDV